MRGGLTRAAERSSNDSLPGANSRPRLTVSSIFFSPPTPPPPPPPPGHQPRRPQGTLSLPSATPVPRPTAGRRRGTQAPSSDPRATPPSAPVHAPARPWRGGQPSGAVLGVALPPSR